VYLGIKVLGKDWAEILLPWYFGNWLAFWFGPQDLFLKVVPKDWDLTFFWGPKFQEIGGFFQTGPGFSMAWFFQTDGFKRRNRGGKGPVSKLLRWAWKGLGNHQIGIVDCWVW